MQPLEKLLCFFFQMYSYQINLVSISSKQACFYVHFSQSSSERRKTTREMQSSVAPSVSTSAADTKHVSQVGQVPGYAQGKWLPSRELQASYPDKAHKRAQQSTATHQSTALVRKKTHTHKKKPASVFVYDLGSFRTVTITAFYLRNGSHNKKHCAQKLKLVTP